MILMIVVAGTSFGAWPLITRSSKLHFLLAGFGLQLGTVIAFGIFIILRRDQLDWVEILNLENGWRLAILALVAGLVNGAGQLAMQKLVSSGVDVSVFAPATLVIMAMVYVIGGWFVYHEPMTVRKVVGLATGTLSLWLLRG